jgi:hypothetical protein
MSLSLFYADLFTTFVDHAAATTSILKSRSTSKSLAKARYLFVLSFDPISFAEPRASALCAGETVQAREKGAAQIALKRSESSPGFAGVAVGV